MAFETSRTLGDVGERAPRLHYATIVRSVLFGYDPGSAEMLRHLRTSLTINRATYPDNERTSALARASSFERLNSRTGKLSS